MYREFFQLRDKPFELLPNPDFLFLSKGHKRALTFLDYGVKSRTGFILLTGEIGSGKTTLIRDLVNRQNREVVLAKVFNTRVDSEQLVSLICDDFGLDVRGKSKFDLLRELNDFLIEQYAAQRQAVLIIDEAQNLSADLLEEIRMLSNLETADAKLLQIILVGQPELRDLLAAPELLQLRQRISVNCHLSPLSRDECAEYLAFRLDKAGNGQAVSFSPEAVDLIHRYTRGVPRLMNILGEYLLIDAFAAGVHAVTGQMVQSIAEEIQFERMYWQTETRLEPDDLPEAVSPASPSRNRKALLVMKLLLEIQQRLRTLEHNRLADSDAAADTAARERLTGLLDRLEQDLLPRLEGLEATTQRLEALERSLASLLATPATAQTAQPDVQLELDLAPAAGSLGLPEPEDFQADTIAAPEPPVAETFQDHLAAAVAAEPGADAHLSTPADASADAPAEAPADAFADAAEPAASLDAAETHADSATDASRNEAEAMPPPEADEPHGTTATARRRGFLASLFGR